MDPLLTIVIVNFNYGRFLETTIQSLLSQSCQDFELIIVDAESTDNSVDIIKKHAERLAWWCSEPDKGQSDAFNKGFSHASGRFLTWLNADDILLPGAIEAFASAVRSAPDREWFVGGCFWLNPELKVMKCAKARTFSKIRAHCGQISAYGPSSFFSRKLYEKAGKIDTDLHYMMDTEYWLRLFHRENAMYSVIPYYIWGLRLHPEAKMSGHNFSESPMADSLHPVWGKRKKEAEFIQNRFPIKHRMNAFVRLLTCRPVGYLTGKLHECLLKGKPYTAWFKP